ncbi:MAG: DUF4912 domain-containing protein [Chthoniobacterales bacterium]
MAFKLNPENAAKSAPEFRVSAQLVVPDEGQEVAAERAAPPELPTFYGTQSLTLMARDPRTLFAYWDVDWQKAFAEEQPRERKVHLRVRRADGAEESTTEIEPMAGGCYVSVQDGDTAYVGEIGYFQPAGVWNLVASSEKIMTPAEAATEAESELVTVPFHLSFQRMLDVFRASKYENESLTEMLQDLRGRATTGPTHESLTRQEAKISRAVDQAIEAQPKREPVAAKDMPDLWHKAGISQAPGLGGASPSDGFGGLGGSSRAF